MVRFEKDKIIIVVESRFPEADWLETCRDIIDAVTEVDDDFRSGNNFYNLMNLLKEMLPTPEQLK
ncbi:MAG TPA: hypothetical protein DDW85_00755 [Porphyromonadaceae bacterium]|nr:hypothetical protein [Porphyromonadaceae bacterium]